MKKANHRDYHRCCVKVNLDAIDHNLSEIKAHIKKGVMTMAVVKADAYGHGSVAVSKHIEDNVDYFAVACLDEAMTLREGGIKKPILILSYTHSSFAMELIENDIIATVYDFGEAKLLSDTALSVNGKIRVHIAVDTGMGRIGVQPDDEGVETVRKISNLKGLEIEGLFSHFACADSADKTVTNAQTALFDNFVSRLESMGVRIPLKHICNSAGTMELDNQYDMCRVGVSLYGLYPSDEVDKNKMNLIPAMKVVSRIVHVKDVPAGFKIGYGHTYVTPSPKRIATVSIGYADGYNRAFTGVGYVLVNGKKAPIVGKVCMDLIMIDVTDIDDVCVDAEVVVLGKSGKARITAEELGAMINSFNYEVICTFMPRATRIYFSEE